MQNYTYPKVLYSYSPTKKHEMEEIDKSKSLSTLQSQIAQDLQDQLHDVQQQLIKLKTQYVHGENSSESGRNDNITVKYNQLKIKYTKLKEKNASQKKEISSLQSKISEYSSLSQNSQLKSTSEANSTESPLKSEHTQHSETNSSSIVSVETYSDSNSKNSTINGDDIARELKVERHRRINAQKELIVLKKKIKELLEKQQNEKSTKEDETSTELVQKLTEQSNKNMERADRAENELLKQKGAYNQLKANYDTLLQTVSVLRSENAAITQERNSFANRTLTLEAQLKENSMHAIEKDAYKLKITDMMNDKTSLEKKYNESQEEIKGLNHEIVRLEAMLTRTKDENYKSMQTIKTYEGDLLTLSRFGFLLADALGQHFNPSSIELEIERLLEIVKSEHSEYQMFHPQQIRMWCSECGRPL